MQNFDLTLTSTNKAQSFNVRGRGVWFESISTTPTDSRIVVVDETGLEIQLRPNQGAKFPQESGRFYVKSFDGVSTITGKIIIGNGEFFDNSTNIAAVQISNEVEIKNDTGKPLAVSGALVNTSLYSQSSLVANTGLSLIAPASNTNGLVLNNAYLMAGAAGGVNMLIAHTASPTLQNQGIAIAAIKSNGSSLYGENINLNGIRIPAGYGLYLFSNTADAGVSGFPMFVTCTIL